MADSFDVVVIGGGPGGYAAAIRCAQKKASVALVEKGDMGGTCLNRGCIPSKALLGSAHFLTLAKHANLMGLEISGLKPNWAKMQSRKDAIVMGFRKGVTGLVQGNKIKLFEGTGVITAPGKVKIETESGSGVLDDRDGKVDPAAVFANEVDEALVSVGGGDVAGYHFFADEEGDLVLAPADVAEVGVGHLAGAVHDAAHHGDLESLQVGGAVLDPLGVIRNRVRGAHPEGVDEGDVVDMPVGSDRLEVVEQLRHSGGPGGVDGEERDLEAVVVERVVTRGDHHPGVERAAASDESQPRGADDSGVHGIAAM